MWLWSAGNPERPSSISETDALLSAILAKVGIQAFLQGRF